MDPTASSLFDARHPSMWNAKRIPHRVTARAYTKVTKTAELIGKAYDYMLTLPRPEGHNANQQRALARRKGWPKPTIGDHWKKAS